MSAVSTPLRSPVTWFGGKGHLARRIVALLPPHECYVEPCVGAGAVFWWKPRAPLETINDLAGDVVHFYRVLRDPVAFERFSRLAALTPYARGVRALPAGVPRRRGPGGARLGLVRQRPTSVRWRDRRRGGGGDAHRLAL